MPAIPVNLAAEDELSEAVLRRLLAFVNRDYQIGTVYRRGGFGYLRRTLSGWNSAAKGIPFVVLTDLDNAECPGQLLQSWLEGPKHPNLLFRVAVREVEAWLLSDRLNISRLVGCRAERVPGTPDDLPDPKRTLVALAREARRSEAQMRIVPRRGSTAQQGPDYNSCLVEFVVKKWDVIAAMNNSPSLHRTVDRLASFTPTWALESR